MFYNNILSIPVLVVCTFVLEDWTSANILKNFPVETRDRIFFAMFITGIGTVFISYTSAWCVRVTSAATYSMVGALNKIPIAVSGLIFFDVPVTIPSVSAIIIGSISGIVYALARLQQQQKKTSGLPTVNPVMSASGQSARDSLRG
jgi:GDP-mannose transporter